MMGFRVMLTKEWVELWRTRRLLVLLLAAVFVGYASPATAALLPQLLGAIPEDQLQGIELLMLRPPGLEDALGQLLKNFSLLPLVLTLAAMGTIAGERKAHTAEMVFCLPVDRGAFVLAKLMVWTLSALGAGLLALLLGGGSSELLFGGIHWPTFAAAGGLMLLSMAWWALVVVVCSAFSPSGAVAGGLTLASYAALSALGALPTLAPFTPAGLMGAAADILLGRTVQGLHWTLAVTLALALAGVAGAIRRVRREEI